MLEFSGWEECRPGGTSVPLAALFAKARLNETVETLGEVFSGLVSELSP